MSRFIFGGVLAPPVSHVQVRPPLEEARPDLFVPADHEPVVVDWRADEDERAFPLALATVLEHCARADTQCVRDAAALVARRMDLRPIERSFE